MQYQFTKALLLNAFNKDMVPNNHGALIAQRDAQDIIADKSRNITMWKN